MEQEIQGMQPQWLTLYNQSSVVTDSSQSGLQVGNMHTDLTVTDTFLRV